MWICDDMIEGDDTNSEGNHSLLKVVSSSSSFDWEYLF